MSKYKKANKPWEIVDANGVRIIPICFTEKKNAKAHLRFIGGLSKKLRKINVWQDCKVALRTDSVYAK